jgi:carotenoid cleavage dioxygenase
MYLNESGRIETHDFGKGRFASEAVFVPRARPEGQECREDDGFLLHVVYDSTTDSSDLVGGYLSHSWYHNLVIQPFRYAQVILDAKRVGESPPLCTIHLPVRAPFTFHGIWTPETFGVGEQFCSAPATP